jgi:hypothetical protein
MKQNETKKNSKKLAFNCEKCGFITCSKNDYDRHLMTAKHKNETNETQKTQKNSVTLNCKKCGILFNSRTTLWRHGKKCDAEESEENETPVLQNPDIDSMMTSETICKLLKELTFTQQQNAEYNKQMIEIMKTKNQTVSNITTTNNTQININMFLNEHCKDAITIGDFIKSIQPSVEDVLYMTKYGNKEGLSKILTNALGQLEITERPLHCTDLKRHTTYVKEPEGWIKENDQSHMKRLCAKTQHECMKTAVSILGENPKYLENGTEEYENSIKMMAETSKEPDHEYIARTIEEQAHLGLRKLLPQIT